MRLGKKSFSYLLIFAGAFPFFALLRVLTELYVPSTVNGFYMIAQLGCSITVMCWMLSVRKRIIHSETRHYLQIIGGLFLLYFFLQMTRYCLFVESAVVRRYMWYAYYTPMAFIPVFGLFVILCFSLPEGEKLNRRWLLFLIPAALFSLAFLTNDLHFLAFAFPNGIELEADGRTLGPVFFAYWAFLVVPICIAVHEMVHVSSNISRKSILFSPFIPLMLGIAYVVVFSFWPQLVKIGDIKMLEIAEAFGFMLIGFLEGCIRIGLIPSNTGYAALFSLTTVPARVTDADGNTVFTSKGAEGDFLDDEDHRLFHVPVKGGNLVYLADLTAVNSLNRQLSEVTADLETRNELLRYENEIAEEREKSEAAIRIYDRISALVRPQILAIQEHLPDSGDEEQFRKDLARSAVLNAYVKRRTNMELEAQKDGTLPFRELVTAMAESLEYYKLSGTETFLSSSGEGQFPAEYIAGAYHAFEMVLEYLFGLTAYITVRLEEQNGIRIRFLFSGNAGIPDLSGLRAEGCDMEYTVEENDAELLLCLREEAAV